MDLNAICHNTLVRVNSENNKIESKLISVNYLLKDIKETVAKPTDDEKLAKDRLDVLCAVLNMEDYLKEIKEFIEVGNSLYLRYFDEYKKGEKQK